MKMPLERATKISFVLLVLFAIFVAVGILNLFLKSLPLVFSISILAIAVAVTMLLFGELEGFLLFIAALVLGAIFIVTLNVELTLASWAVVMGAIVILIAAVS